MSGRTGSRSSSDAPDFVPLIAILFGRDGEATRRISAVDLRRGGIWGELLWSLNPPWRRGLEELVRQIGVEVDVDVVDLVELLAV